MTGLKSDVPVLDDLPVQDEFPVQDKFPVSKINSANARAGTVFQVGINAKQYFDTVLKLLLLDASVVPGVFMKVAGM